MNEASESLLDYRPPASKMIGEINVTVLSNQADAPAVRTGPEDLATKAAIALWIILFAAVVIGAVAESAMDPVVRLNALQVVWP